ncbi:hypothetical protein ACFQAT_28205 [Undibacterium arcticum]|uniref:hypothetical protein n=1 Tax=Undibacterium arcticum TaxID=1762892 RepID=UPI003611B2BE
MNYFEKRLCVNTLVTGERSAWTEDDRKLVPRALKKPSSENWRAFLLLCAIDYSYNQSWKTIVLKQASLFKPLPKLSH